MSRKSVALVTGARGFVGNHLVLCLLDRGYEVIATDINERVLLDFRRKIDKGVYPQLKSSFLQIEKCDVNSKNDLRRYINKKIDVVFHLAALSHHWAKDQSLFEKVNVEGTRNVCETILSVPKKIRAVICSSCETLKPLSMGGGSENDLLDEKDAFGPYGLSKIKAEKVVQEFVAKGLDAVVVKPTLPIGPGDDEPTPVGQMIQYYLKARSSFYYPTGFNFVRIGDVVKGMELASRYGKTGESYILGGENMSLEGFLYRMHQFAGSPLPKRHVPYPLAFISASFLELWSGRLSNRMPVATREGVRVARHPFEFSIDKARREINYKQASIDDNLKAAIEYYQHQGIGVRR